VEKDVAVMRHAPGAQSIRQFRSWKMKTSFAVRRRGINPSANVLSRPLKGRPFAAVLGRPFQWVTGYFVAGGLNRQRQAGVLLAALVLILLLAAALRFHALGAQSFWNDEGNSYVQAMRPFADIAANAARDIHPPGYYWLLAGWRLLAGTSEFALRAFSAFASLLSIAFAAALGRRLFGGAAALTAALLIALNTFSIYYAQEARMYALLALWASASMWALAGFLRRLSARWGLALALFNAAGLWTQYAYPFVMLAQGLTALVWLATTRRGLRGLLLYVAANLLTIVLYLPWLPTALHQVTTWPNTGDATPLPQALNTVLNWLIVGSTAPQTALAIPGLLVLFGLLIAQRRAIWRAALPAAWVVVPVGLFLALGMFRPDNVKLLLPAQIGLALWVGRGVQVLWALRLRVGRRRDLASMLTLVIPPATALLSVLWLALAAWDGIASLYDDPDFQRSDYRAIVQAIALGTRPDDAIILDAPNQEEVFRYYYRGDAAVYPLPAGLGGDDAATEAAVSAAVRAHPRIFAVFWGEAERDPRRVVESVLSRDAYEIDSQWYGDVRLVRYVAPQGDIAMQESGTGFGDHILLLGYGLSATTARQGDALQVALRWVTDAPLEKRYKVFAQLLDANGALVAQQDSEPGGGLNPTTSWEAHQAIEDRHALLLDLPPGAYTLIVGLYDLDDPAARLHVSNDGDYLTLGTVTVEAG
jgi:4-amino-4-deoxy-L-arabinose transferase-like glycosyltransferase